MDAHGRELEVLQAVVLALQIGDYKELAEGILRLRVHFEHLQEVD